MTAYHHYENTEVRKMRGGSKIVRRVTIKNGKGTKSVSRYRGGKHVGTVRRPIPKKHVKLILNRKFVPGLFKECQKKD